MKRFLGRIEKSVLIIFFFLFCLPKLSVANNTWSYASFALPISVEQSQVKSNILIVADYQNIPIAFSDINQSSVEPIFIKTQAGFLSTGDFSDYLSLAYQTSSVNSQQDLFNSFNGAYKTLNPNTLGAQFRWGGIDYSVLTSNQKRSMFVPFITIRNTGSFQSGFGFLLDPVIQNLSLLNQSIQTDPKDYFAGADTEREYTVKITPSIPSPDGNDDSIELKFNGQLVDDKVCRKGKKWVREDRNFGRYAKLIEFYEESLLKFKNDQIDAYLTFFSPESQARLQKMFNAMTSDQVKRYVTVAGGTNHHLKFILDGDILKFMFYQTVENGPCIMTRLYRPILVSEE